jgi:hypothetical protein
MLWHSCSIRQLFIVFAIAFVWVILQKLVEVQEQMKRLTARVNLCISNDEFYDMFDAQWEEKQVTLTE